ncbi:hypothetical protein [Pseudomonas huanghezhanensis]|uniref:hypothetical protein n=1 Tax=Pseudomonas huanghezhanensis TaxID=3002903 RepID=UPI0022860253|nr:hypothetical protein [Pseudomonas sp. BSw22131]
MTIKAVLTGDLIHSRSVGDTQAYLAALKQVLADLQHIYGFTADIYRGDGFQVVLDEATHALKCALAIRAGLISASPDKERWDARVAVGIGSAESDFTYGEAFILSGQGLDSMKKATLAVFSNDERFNERTELTTDFVAAIVEKWTVVEARTYCMHLVDDDSQETIAQVLGKSRITVNKTLRRAQARLLDRYLQRVGQWIKELADA